MNLMIECEDRLEWFAKKYAGRPLAGSNPGFDRAFLLEHFGRVARHFHYRLFDVNTLVAFFDILKPRTNRHRALADIYDDLRLTQELARRFSLLT
jgi:oligoribonuclease (3'-5' exoribonuclease)